jgi:hypothetical protein
MCAASLQSDFMFAAQRFSMSGKDAQREARHWIEGLNLQNVKGRLIDLREPTKSSVFRVSSERQLPAKTHSP